jgi:hypothetical protein
VLLDLTGDAEQHDITHPRRASPGDRRGALEIIHRVHQARVGARDRFGVSTDGRPEDSALPVGHAPPSITPLAVVVDRVHEPGEHQLPASVDVGSDARSAHEVGDERFARAAALPDEELVDELVRVVGDRDRGVVPAGELQLSVELEVRLRDPLGPRLGCVGGRRSNVGQKGRGDRAVILRRMVEAGQTRMQAFALRSDVVVTVLDDGAVLLDLESKYFYELNASAWAVTRLFEVGATPDQAEAATRSWGAPDGVVESVLAALADEGLVAATPAGSSPEVPAYEGVWDEPRVEKQPEPLQRVMVSAFDPSLPLAE